MAEEPEEVDVVHHVAAEVVGEEVEVEIPVGGQHQRGHGQRRQGEDHDDRGADYRPAEDWHAQEVHARRAFLVDRDGKVDSRQRRADPRQNDGPDPVVRPRTGLKIGTGIRRVVGPAAGRELAQYEGDHHQRCPRCRQPEADLVHHRKGHVTRADLQRHHVVDHPGDKGYRDEEDHDGAVGTEQLREVVRRQEPTMQAKGLLGPHQHALNHATGQHDQRQRAIHDADSLVIDTGQPVAPERPPEAEPGQQYHRTERPEDHHHGGPCPDHFAERRIFEGPPER